MKEMRGQLEERQTHLEELSQTVSTVLVSQLSVFEMQRLCPMDLVYDFIGQLSQRVHYEVSNSDHWK